jgi:outer membrane protein TolC
LEQQRRADVAFAVRAAYVTAGAAHAEATVQQGTLQTLHDYESLLQRQERLGLVTRNDTLRARLAADIAAAAERAAVAERDAALSELSTLTGVALATDSLVEPATAHFIPADTTAIEASPVLIDAQAAVEAARRDADAVRSEWRSHLQLTASGGALGVVPERTFRDNGGGQFLFGFSVPLYDGGATTARVAAAAAAADSAAALLRESRQTLTTALARVAVEARRAEADLAAWHSAVPRAAENFELMRARYFGGGNVRLLEVLDALTQYVDAQLAVQRAVFADRIVVAKQQQLIGEMTP